jgi:hypothetical protein
MEKLRKIRSLARTCSFSAEIWTQGLPNTRESCWPLDPDTFGSKDVSQTCVAMAVSSEMWESNSEDWGRYICTPRGLSPWKHSWSRNMLPLFPELTPDLTTKIRALCPPPPKDWYPPSKAGVVIALCTCFQNCLVWVSAELRQLWQGFFSLSKKILAWYVD